MTMRRLVMAAVLVLTGAVPAAAKPAEPGKATEKALSKAFGGSKKLRFSFGPPAGRCTVSFFTKSNMTAGLTKDSVRLNATKALKAIQSAGNECKVIVMEGRLTLVDQLGNESEGVVARATYLPEIVAKINFKNFYFKDVFNTPVPAATAKLHPAIVY